MIEKSLMVSKRQTLNLLAGIAAVCLCAGSVTAQQKEGFGSKEATKQTETEKAQEKSAAETMPQEQTGSSSSKQADAAATETVKRIWRVGATIRGGGRPATNLKLTFPIPTDWPEQHVNLYKENIPSEARSAEFRMSDGVKQMVAIIPRLGRGVQIELNVLMEITLKAIPYPDRTDHLVIPKRPPRDIRLHLVPSKLIESRQRSVRNKVKELTDKDLAPWEQARAFYEFVTSEIQMDKKSEVLGAKAALKGSTGAIEDRTNVFIALCRCFKIPARTVWADDGEYAEFYLQDDTGEGKWYPVVLDSNHEFGKMSNPRVIIQKGDNIKIPERQQRQRFVVEDISGNVTAGAKPKVRFIRDLLPSRDAK